MPEKMRRIFSNSDASRGLAVDQPPSAVDVTDRGRYAGRRSLEHKKAGIVLAGRDESQGPTAVEGALHFRIRVHGSWQFAEQQVNEDVSNTTVNSLRQIDTVRATPADRPEDLSTLMISMSEREACLTAMPKRITRSPWLTVETTTSSAARQRAARGAMRVLGSALSRIGCGVEFRCGSS
jgi:hypothetical protein